MAILHIEFPAHSLKRNVSFRAIIPLENPMEWQNPPKAEKLKFRTLYLLHGFGGDCSDWLVNTNLCAYAQEHKIAIIMPSGDNSFYLDNPCSDDHYSGFVGKELVDFTRSLFPLSERREDTLIGGLSMGGYGAIRNGFYYADTFCAIIALSSALITEQVATLTEESSPLMLPNSYYTNIFGEPDKLLGSDNDPKALAKNLMQKKGKMPDIYLACGTEDSLLKANQDYADYLKSIGVAHVFETSPGDHEWDFWNRHISRALDWFDALQEHEKEG